MPPATNVPQASAYEDDNARSTSTTRPRSRTARSRPPAPERSTNSIAIRKGARAATGATPQSTLNSVVTWLSHVPASTRFTTAPEGSDHSSCSDGADSQRPESGRPSEPRRAGEERQRDRRGQLRIDGESAVAARTAILQDGAKRGCRRSERRGEQKRGHDQIAHRRAACRTISGSVRTSRPRRAPHDGRSRTGENIRRPLPPVQAHKTAGQARRVVVPRQVIVASGPSSPPGGYALLRRSEDAAER